MIYDSLKTPHNFRSHSFIYPPSKLALYYCDPVGRLSDEPDSLLEKEQISAYSPVKYLNRLKNQLNEKMDFDDYLEFITDAFNLSAYSKLMAGMGRYILNKSDLKYNGISPPDKDFFCFINRNLKNEKKSNITIEIANYSESKKADSAYLVYKKYLTDKYGPSKKSGEYSKLHKDGSYFISGGEIYENDLNRILLHHGNSYDESDDDPSFLSRNRHQFGFSIIISKK